MNEPTTPGNDLKTALLLIAHGSRRAEANADLDHLAERIRARGDYAHVQASYLELCPPDIVAGGVLCVESGVDRVILSPYFLSAGIHVAEDLTAARDELKARYPEKEFILAEPLGRHPLLMQVVLARAAEVDAI